MKIFFTERIGMGEEKVYLCGIRVTIYLKIVLPIQQHVISPRYTYKLYYANIFLHRVIQTYVYGLQLRPTFVLCIPCWFLVYFDKSAGELKLLLATNDKNVEKKFYSHILFGRFCMRNLLFLSFRGVYFKNIACFPLTLQPLRDNRRIFEKKICFVVREKWNVNTKY